MKRITSSILLTSCLVLQSACDRATEAENGVGAATTAVPTSTSTSTSTSSGLKQPFPTVAPIPSIADGSASVGLELESLDQQASYGIGYRIGSSILKDQNIQVAPKAILAGLKDGLEGRQRLTEENMRTAAQGLKRRAAQTIAEVNEARGDEAVAFLKENAGRNGVEMTSSGLQYEILTEPTDQESPKPKLTDFVTVAYHGTLLDGSIIDSSMDREPLTVAVRGVIPGWIEALQLMAVGEKRRLYLPPTLGYGREGAGSVPPYSVLTFDLELIGIQSAAASDNADDEALPTQSQYTR